MATGISDILVEKKMMSQLMSGACSFGRGANDAELPGTDGLAWPELFKWPHSGWAMLQIR